jgi:hypothetical protein
MASKTLTRTEGYALTDAHTAVRLSVNVLLTHTACYEWRDTTDCWERTHNQMRVVHSRGVGNRGWTWDRKQKQFVVCACDPCQRGSR